MFFLSFHLGDQSSLVAGLIADVQFCRQCTFSASTVKNYDSYFRVYNRLCALLHIALVLTSTGNLCINATFLACFLLPQSVCCMSILWASSIKNMVSPLHNPLVDNWLISSVIRRIRWVYSIPVKSCPPITLDILLGIFSDLNILNSWHASFGTIFLVFFWAVLESTPPAGFWSQI